MRYSEDEVRLYALARERSLIDDVKGVAEALRQLVQLRPDSALFNASLANALNSLGQVDVAEHLFKKAVSLAPRSEKISLGLFHCLWAGMLLASSHDHSMKGIRGSRCHPLNVAAMAHRQLQRQCAGI